MHFLYYLEVCSFGQKFADWLLMSHFAAMMLTPIAIFIGVKMAQLCPKSRESHTSMKQGPWGLLEEGRGHAHSRRQIASWVVGAGMEVKQWNGSPLGSCLALMGFVFSNSWEPQSEGCRWRELLSQLVLLPFSLHQWPPVSKARVLRT